MSLEKRMAKVAIIGTVGVPANYGGFETLAENLVTYNDQLGRPFDVHVYCSVRSYSDRLNEYRGARLHYVPFSANGMQSIFYDVWSMIDACVRGVDTVLLLGHGGSFAIPFLKPFIRTKFITNVDGIEWRREKWSGVARWILRKSEAVAIRCSDVIVADNEAIRQYIFENFRKDCEVIPYGGDHALSADPDLGISGDLPYKYALALCRIEPENKVDMILDAWRDIHLPLLFVGNWQSSAYGRELRLKYKDHPSVIFQDAVYEPRALRAIRNGAAIYIHGHSAGGTNPALVEMMHFGVPVLAYDCSFNRYTTEGRAEYFRSAEGLVGAVMGLTPQLCAEIGVAMKDIAAKRYTWRSVGDAYFSLFGR